MVKTGRRRTAFSVALGIFVITVAVALSTSWIVLNWRTGVLLVLGVLFFGVIITGVVLNTIFLVREVRRNEQHDAFINAVTHELKTPVSSMRLYLQTLKSREVSPDKREEFYDIMLQDSDRLHATIEQVLRAGRVASGKKNLHRGRVDLREVVQECLDTARRRHHLDAGALEYSEAVASDHDSTVVGDVDELRAAVSNLIDNAVKYSGAQIKVWVELARTNANQASIRVRDQGIGIPGPELKRIFKRFYRIQSAMASRVKGTGLGLFIVQSVAERHGGRAYAESEGAGRGSTFTLQIPLAPPE